MVGYRKIRYLTQKFIRNLILIVNILYKNFYIEYSLLKLKKPGSN